jgi:hypothetical protein
MFCGSERLSVPMRNASQTHWSCTARASSRPADSYLVLVSGMSSGAILTAVLDALKSCLDANAIAAVKMSINDQQHVMEGPP